MPAAVRERHHAAHEARVRLHLHLDRAVLVPQARAAAGVELARGEIVRMDEERVRRVRAAPQAREVRVPAVVHPRRAARDELEARRVLGRELLVDALGLGERRRERLRAAVDAPVRRLDVLLVEGARLEPVLERDAVRALAQLREREPARAQHVVDPRPRVGVRRVERRAEPERLRQAREDPPLLAPLAARLHHAVGELHPRPELEPEPGDVDVGALEHVGRREQVVRVLAGGGAVEVDAYEQLEPLEGAPQPRLARDRQQRIAGHHEERADRAARLLDRVREQGARQGPAAQRAELGVDEALLVTAAARLGAAVEAHREHVPAAPVEVAGDEREHVQEPVGEGALPAHVHARRHVHGRARRLGELAGEGADALGRDPGHARRALGRVAVHERAQALHVLAVARDRLLVEAAQRVDLGQQRREQVHVGVGSDRQPLAGARRHRLDPARVHEHDPRAPRTGVAQHLHRVRDRDEAHVADARVGAQAQEEVGVREVRDGMDRARAEHRLAAGELVGAVLGAGAEGAARAELREEGADRRPGERVEGGRVAHVGGDRLGSVAREQVAHARGDLLHGDVPGDALEAAGAAAQRVIEPVGVAVDVEPGDALVAGEAAGHGMGTVGPQGDELAVLDVREQPAGGLADPAEGRDGAGGHGREHTPGGRPKSCG